MERLPPLDSYIRDVAKVRAQTVEERLREALEAGQREVMIADPRGDGSLILYEVPTWRRHPIKRFRLFWPVGV